MKPESKKFLHVGCGFNDRTKTTPVFLQPEWKEVRLDVNADAPPDILASFLDLNTIPDGSYDAVFLSHVIEHVYIHQALRGVRELSRVLKNDGFAIVRCPDMQGICQLVADGKLFDTFYDTPVEGPITPHDIIYGHTRSIARGETWMAHLSGHTATSLTRLMKDAGFGSTLVQRRKIVAGNFYIELFAVASKTALPSEHLIEILNAHTRPMPLIAS